MIGDAVLGFGLGVGFGAALVFAVGVSVLLRDEVSRRREDRRRLIRRRLGLAT